MRKFSGASENVTVEHAFHTLIIVCPHPNINDTINLSDTPMDMMQRAFSRANIHLLKASTKHKHINEGPDRDAPSDTDKAKKRKLMGTAAEGNDFWSKLTEWFEDKVDEYGTRNMNVGPWAAYVSSFIKNLLR